MTKGRIIFVGSFWEYFGLSIALLILTVVTLGLALPYWVFWSFKYFFGKMEIELYDAPSVNVTVPPASGERSLEPARHL